MVISSTAPPIIRDAVAISVMSDREGAKKASGGPAQVRKSWGGGFSRAKGKKRRLSSACCLLRYVFWFEIQMVYSLDGRSCAQVQVRTLAMRISDGLSPDHRVGSCYFGCTKKSRAVWQPSAPNAEVARQRMQPNPPVHLKANGDTSRADGGTPLSGRRPCQGGMAAPFAETACKVCTLRRRPCVNPCDGRPVPETCCFVKSARYFCCDRDDAYCDMKPS
jgi:hypothetical protein